MWPLVISLVPLMFSKPRQVRATRLRCVGFLCIASLALSMPVAAEATGNSKGLEIAQQRKAVDAGWGDTIAEMTMRLRNARGDQSLREIRVKSLEVRGDGDKSLTIFDSPADVRGTALLTFSKVEGADDQWIFLPAVKRVKRIASRSKSGPFMGSEFAYEDMSSFEVAKFQHRHLRDEQFNEHSVHVVEQVPTDPYSGYSKVITYIDTDNLTLHKAEYYDRKGSLLKVLEASDYRQYKTRFWRAHRLYIHNHQTDKSTELLIEALTFDNGLSDADFNQAVLRRAR